jgi:hypothetical protein
MAGRYRITSPTIALIKEEGRHVAHTIQAGEVVKIVDETLDGDRLVDVVWGGRVVMMFAQDLRSRSTSVD